ncbi:MAG: radical SAM protein [Polyangiaceae bacterium]
MELTLFVDHACNLRCSYCYTGSKTPRPMSMSTAERAIDFALARDPSGLTLAFFGGEPTLHIEWLERVRAYATARLAEANPRATLILRLNTNATLVSDRVADFVRSSSVVDAFVSLDGPAAIHDRHRLNVQGHGSHASVLQGIERLAKAGARVVTLAVISPDTADALGEILLEAFGLPLARVHVTCNLRATWDTVALEALRRGLARAATHWVDAFRAGRIIHFEPLTTKILSHLHAAMPCANRCQLGFDEVVVAPSGRLYTCGELVGEDQDHSLSIGDIENGIDVSKLSSLREQKNRIEVSCADCEIRERCSSACGCKHVALTGTFGAVTQTLCDTETAFIEAADAVAEALYRERCDAFLDFFYRKGWAPSSPQAYVQLRRKDDLKLVPE